MITKNKYSLNFGKNNYLILLLIITSSFAIGFIITYFLIGPLIKNYFIPYIIYNFKLFTSEKIPEGAIEQTFRSLRKSLSLFIGFLFEIPIILIYFDPLIKRSHQTMFILRLVLIIIWIFSAFITPQDIISQILVAVPLTIFMELLIQISKIVYKKLPI